MLLLKLNGAEGKGGKQYEKDPCTASKIVCILLPGQMLLLSSQPEKHLRFVVPSSPPANHCLAVAVCPCSPGFLLHRRCADEPRCETVPVLSSSLPGPFSGLHQNYFLGTEPELRLH